MLLQEVAGASSHTSRLSATCRSALLCACTQSHQCLRMLPIVATEPSTEQPLVRQRCCSLLQVNITNADLVKEDNFSPRAPRGCPRPRRISHLTRIIINRSRALFLSSMRPCGAAPLRARLRNLEVLFPDPGRHRAQSSTGYWSGAAAHPSRQVRLGRLIGG